MTVKITVEGIDKATKYLQIKKKAIQGKLKLSMFKVGAFMQGEVKESIAGRRAEPTSVDTGRFLNSVEFSPGLDSVTIFSNVPYAKFLEYGTTRIQARSHFRNSKSRNKLAIVRLIEESLKSI